LAHERLQFGFYLTYECHSNDKEKQKEKKMVKTMNNNNNKKKGIPSFIGNLLTYDIGNTHIHQLFSISLLDTKFSIIFTSDDIHLSNTKTTNNQITQHLDPFVYLDMDVGLIIETKDTNRWDQ
jgi:hypothetical protein